MKCMVVLTEAEEPALQQLSTDHPYQESRKRAVALPLVAPARGKLRPIAVGAKLGVSGQSICYSVHTWREKGYTLAIENWP